MQRVKSGRSCNRGFTLIELLIVVAIIGIIAAIAIPNLMISLQKARQKRSMSDMRIISTALQSYAIDNSIYPRIGNTTVSALAPHLKNIIKVLPSVDGWAKPMPYKTNAAGLTFTIISYGSNRAPDLPYTYGYTLRTRDDIVYSGTSFIQWPEVRQTGN